MSLFKCPLNEYPYYKTSMNVQLAPCANIPYLYTTFSK